MKYKSLLIAVAVICVIGSRIIVSNIYKSDMKSKIADSSLTTKEELTAILNVNRPLFERTADNLKGLKTVDNARLNRIVIQDLYIYTPVRSKHRIMITNAEKESKKSVDLRLAKEILVNLEFSRITVSDGCVRFFYRTYFTTEGSLLYSEDIDNSEYADEDAYTIEPIDKNWYYCVPY